MHSARRCLSAVRPIVLLVLLAGCQSVQNGNTPSVARESARPNFLLIVVDDMGLADLGSFGGEIPTPNLDRLANEGIRLTNFHAAPVCSATRAMLLTGVDSHKAGLGNMAEDLAPNQIGMPGHEGELNQHVVTIASLLQDAGYGTFMTGKWHLGKLLETSPWAKGFDHSFTLLAGAASHYPDMQPAYSPDPKGKAPYREDQQLLESLPAGFKYSTQFYTDRMIDYLHGTSAAQKPFFAYLAYTAPHWPLQAPAEAIARFKGRYDAGYDVLREQRLAQQHALGVIPANANGNLRPLRGKPWETLSKEQQQVQARAMEVYAAMIDEVDRNVGRLLDALRASGRLDNTVIIFISDNGPEGHDLDETWPVDKFPEIRRNIDERHDFSLANMGAPNSYVLYGPNWARAGSPAFRLHKGFPTEGGTRVPAFFHYRGFLQHRISDRFFTVKDIAPTVLELAGLTHPAPRYAGHDIEPLTGVSMLPALTHADILDARDDRVYAGEMMGKYFVRKGQWKMIYIQEPYGPGRPQLYDLEQDPGEAQDLAARRPDVLAALTAEWHRYVSENGVILPDWVSGY